ncbi:unnamed protein product [marine sediment metagenome]|uniref:Uncharacterized protein n=1 Tax=marine sediment metagenome TaxID=412755 RepID=X1EUP2_9ZZZZ
MIVSEARIVELGEEIRPREKIKAIDNLKNNLVRDNLFSFLNILKPFILQINSLNNFMTPI